MVNSGGSSLQGKVLMSQPIVNNQNQTAAPGVVPYYTPLSFPDATFAAPAAPTGPQSYTHMPDGSWADAQVTLSGASADPNAPTPAPGSEEEALVQFYAQQMAFDDMMFQQQMMVMQQRSMLAQRQAMAARNNSNVEVKWVQSPDLKSFYDDCGDCGEE